MAKEKVDLNDSKGQRVFRAQGGEVFDLDDKHVGTLGPYVAHNGRTVREAVFGGRNRGWVEGNRLYFYPGQVNKKALTGLSKKDLPVPGPPPRPDPFTLPSNAADPPVPPME